MNKSILLLIENFVNQSKSLSIVVKLYHKHIMKGERGGGKERDAPTH